MAKYQVRRGKRFGMASLEWPAIVELRARDAAGFLDLLELVTEPVMEPEDEPARIVTANDAPQPGAVAELEQKPEPAPVKPAGRKKA
jgi:hypothetical protein